MPRCGGTFDENGVAQAAVLWRSAAFKSPNLTQNRRPL